MADRKEIQKALRTRPGKPPVAVFHPDDIARAQTARQQPAFIVPADTQTGVDQESNKGMQLARKDAMESLVQQLIDMRKKPDVRISERLFLKIPEAAEYSGLPQSDIRRMMAEGKIEGRRTGAGWRIRRTDLEKI